MMESLSVIIPVYNAGRYLGECVDSILGELWEGCRVILVDDGSDDGSGSLCEDYARRHPGRVVCVRTANVGVSEARNTGIDMATTPLIAFCDADDAYLKGGLRYLAGILLDNGCDIAVGNFCRRPDTVPVPEKTIVCSGEEALVNTLYQRGGWHESAWAKVYRRRLFDDARFVSGRRYEDIEILPRLYLSARKVAFTKTPVYYYRPNPASFINTWSPARADAVFACRSVAGYVGERCPGALPAAQSRLFSAAFNIFSLAGRHGQKDIAIDCWQIIRRLRRQVWRDGNVRLKNKAGVAISLFGRHAGSLITRLLDRKA